MKRDMDEMLASQRAMLKRLNKNSDENDHDIMQENFDKHLGNVEKWLGSQLNIDVIYMKYGDIVSNPYKNAKVLTKFLSDRLDAKRMAQVVEKTLYRQRKEGMKGVNS